MLHKTIAATLLTAAGFSAPAIAAPAVVVQPLLLQQMQETIQRQQEQLQQQAEQIRTQAETLRTLQQQVHALQHPSPAHAPPAPASVAASQKPPAETSLKTPLPAVKSGSDRISLTLSGQINRAVNVVNDGRGTNIYHVDNNASNSRFRLVGTAQISNDLTLGSRIEVAVTPDVSSQVSQTNQAPGTFFDQRWTEVSLASKSYGKLSLGKGDAASNTTAEIDLSRTDLVQYSAIADIAGGMLFSEANGSRKLTALKVSDAFKNMDGLSRQSRLRYDSPGLYGFSLAGSLVSGQRYDVVLNWSGEGYGFRSAAAFSLAHPKLAGYRLMYDGSFSLLHTASGLNLTLSGGLLERDFAKDATNLFAKAGWIASFSKLGYTAFGIDYTRSENTSAVGDKGYSVGAAVVQAFEKYATELYLQYRIYSLDRANQNPVADITVGTFGARVKF